MLHVLILFVHYATDRVTERFCQQQVAAVVAVLLVQCACCLCIVWQILPEA